MPGLRPNLAETLNSLGVYHFDQIADWRDSDIDWVDTHLNFPGRIVRENWIEQAKALAIGGRDEYVKVFGKEPR
jgi:predicted flap endonuclease-1-like 5' DNA nuclease